jgi:hypothetical protein
MLTGFLVTSMFIYVCGICAKTTPTLVRFIQMGLFLWAFYLLLRAWL